MAGQGQREENRFDAEREGDVCLNHAHGAMAHADGLGDLAEVVLHQRRVHEHTASSCAKR